MIIVNMATFPDRINTLPTVLERVLPQVDKINLCLNEYKTIPHFLNHKKINAFIPLENYRDLGKFLIDSFDYYDDIFYMDDDILYPLNYIETMLATWNNYKALDPIVGVHGIIYPDIFDGSVNSRRVYAFQKSLRNHKIVNQLGTGTIHCKGFQVPSFNFMLGSKRYVDVRYARHTVKNLWPMICIKRKDLWLEEIAHKRTIFSTFTKKWPMEVIRECQNISGYRKLNTEAIIKIEMQNKT